MRTSVIGFHPFRITFPFLHSHWIVDHWHSHWTHNYNKQQFRDSSSLLHFECAVTCFSVTYRSQNTFLNEALKLWELDAQRWGPFELNHWSLHKDSAGNIFSQLSHFEFIGKRSSLQAQSLLTRWSRKSRMWCWCFYCIAQPERRQIWC